MGRKKGSIMTEEAKLAMREKRQANRLGKESAFVTVWEGIKYLNYEQLDSVSNEIARLIELKKEEEKIKLIKMKEIIEGKLQAISGNY